MKIRVGYDLTYSCTQPTPAILMLNVHPSRTNDLLSPHCLVTDPEVASTNYVDSFGNVCTRLVAPPGDFRIHADALVSDSGLADEVAPWAQQIPIELLPEESLMFLLGSRYCETDLLSETAWALFGSTPPGWARVQAICDYVHNHITFGYDDARSTRTAYQAFEERVGVCRDFTHLAVALCRCMNIPARYCTGYLGDIGIPVVPPMDFSAWFEVYLGDRWYVFDARNNMPRIGRILMARGRDAADVPLTNTFGPATLKQFTVWSDEVATEESPNPSLR